MKWKKALAVVLAAGMISAQGTSVFAAEVVSNDGITIIQQEDGSYVDGEGNPLTVEGSNIYDMNGNLVGVIKEDQQPDLEQPVETPSVDEGNEEVTPPADIETPEEPETPVGQPGDEESETDDNQGEDPGSNDVENGNDQNDQNQGEGDESDGSEGDQNGENPDGEPSDDESNDQENGNGEGDNSGEVTTPDKPSETPDEPEAPVEEPGNDSGEVEAPETPDDVKDAVDEEQPEVEVPAEDADENQQPAQPEVPVEVETPAEEPAEIPHQYDQENANYQQYHYSQNLDTERFIAMVGEQARQISGTHDLYASVAIAQAILESDSGNSLLAKTPNFNLFGIKGEWNGNYEVYWTQEDDGTGNLYSMQEKFRKYANYGESFEDYVDLLTNADRMGNYYAGAAKSQAATAYDACYFLEGRYASDTSYAEKLIGLIDTYDLTRYDEPLTHDLQTVNGADTISDVDESGNEIQREFTNDDYARLAGVITSKLGVNYVWGGESMAEGGYDCSGLVYAAYQEALGVELPRTSQTMALLGEEIPFSELQMGDLLFWDDGGDVHHVAMYLGDGYFIQSPHTGDVVKITSMDEYTPDFAKRIMTFESIQ